MEIKLGDVQTFYGPLVSSTHLYCLLFTTSHNDTLEFSSGLADFIAMPLNAHQAIQNTEK